MSARAVSWLEGEPRLSVELVPSTCWFSNLRSELPKETWDVLRKAQAKRAGYRCEVCGGRGPKWPVECHEIWSFDGATYVQRLEGLVSLCPDCHRCKHIGLADLRGEGEEAEAWLAKVNGWTPGQTSEYVTAAFEQWAERSRHEWSLDLNRLRDYGVEPPRVDDRPQVMIDVDLVPVANPNPPTPPPPAAKRRGFFSRLLH